MWYTTPILSKLFQKCTIETHTASGKDSYGKPVTSIVETEVACFLDQWIREEVKRDGRETVVSDGMVFFEKDTVLSLSSIIKDIKDLNDIVIDTRRYEVIRIDSLYDELGRHHYEVYVVLA